MLLIENAMIYDGIQKSPFLGCVLIEGERILDVLSNPPEGFTGERLNAEGLSLCSGFIDSHSHNDFFAVRSDNNRYFEPMLRQGITTMIAGNCGHSASGYDPDTPFYRDLSGLFPFNPDYRACASFSQWFSIADHQSPVNIACLAGHGTIRTSVRGLGSASLSEPQLCEMDRLMEQALEEGAAGISFGLMYDPDIFAPTEELVRAARIARRYDRPITFHMRACSAISTSYDTLFGRPHNLRAIDEAIDIARQSGAKCHLSHIIFVGKRSWRTLDETVSLIDAANQEGLDVSFDIYSSEFGASCINVILPSWYQGMPADEKNSLWTRIRLNAMIFGAKKLLGLSYHDLEITYAGPKHPEYIGKRVDEIAHEKKMRGLNAYLSIIDETDAAASIHMYQYMNPHIIDTLSRHPRVSFMTDAWIQDVGAQNAAAFGSFPKFLRLSREGKAAPLSEMIPKMTYQTAQRFKLRDRGAILPGYYADLTLFDPDTVCEKGCDFPVGIPYVLVNGRFAVRESAFVSGHFGKGLRIL